MFRRQQPPSLEEIGVVIPPHTTFSGELRTTSNVRLGGAVQGGVIDTTGNVVISAGAAVDCTISARIVSIQGSFRGVLRAERVEMLAGSTVDGRLYVKNYFSEKGATVRAAIQSIEAGAVQLGLHFPNEKSIPVVHHPGFA